MSENIVAEVLRQFAGMPAAHFLLHRAPLLLLDRLVEPGIEQTVCEWRVQDSDPFMTPGQGVPAYVGVEYMAQCIAVHAGVRARARGFGPPLGFLLGTRHYRSSIAHMSAGLTYRATCRELISDDNGMGSYECEILFDNERVAEGRLAVLQKEEGRAAGN